jgi:hypothetical protein
MATRIIEYGGADRSDRLQAVPASQRVTSQTALTATGTSQQSAAFSVGVSLICVQSDEAVYVLIGSNPTATTNDYRIAAGSEQFFTVKAGDKVAVRT